MNIINYEHGRYTADVFVKITFDKYDLKIVSALGETDISGYTDQWGMLVNIAQASMLNEFDFSKYEADYDFYTIDMLCYSDLYAIKNGLLRKCFDGWDSLIQTISGFSMKNYLKGDEAHYEVLSISTGEIIDIFMSKDVRADSQLR